MDKSTASQMIKVLEHLHRRDREIGAALTEARCSQNKSISKCAALLGTSRRRYRAIEQGEVGIAASELELLLNYLNIPIHAIWQSTISPVVLQAHPGENILLVLKVR